MLPEPEELVARVQKLEAKQSEMEGRLNQVWNQTRIEKWVDSLRLLPEGAYGFAFLGLLLTFILTLIALLAFVGVIHP